MKTGNDTGRNLFEDEAMERGQVLYVQTPIGPMRLRMKGGLVWELDFDADATHLPVVVGSSPGVDLYRQVQEYLQGIRKHFQCQLALRGTAFQRTVWEEVARVPYGQTTTYKALAARIGKPRAAVAVGAALAANPFLLIVPCHRVLAANGSLQGYAGALWRKRWLLDMESGRSVQPDLFPYDNQAIG